MRPNVLALVLGINLALAGGLVFLWSDEERWRWKEPEALRPSLDDVVAAQGAEPVDISRYKETLERPLFASTRRPAPRTASGADGQAADALADVRLLGTYGSGDKGGIVVIRGGKVERIAVGASIGDWKVAGGEGRGAALVRASGERRQLELALSATAPSALAADGKAGSSEATGAPGADPGRAAGAGTSAPTAAAATARPAVVVPALMSPEGREQLRQQRLERINARRAQRGLPPLTE